MQKKQQNITIEELREENRRLKEEVRMLEGRIQLIMEINEGRLDQISELKERVLVLELELRNERAYNDESNFPAHPDELK